MGSGEDLREFYLSSHQRLVVGLTALTGNPAEAEDCVQEAFARVIPRWRQLSAYDDPEAWVRRVAWNLAHSRWRAIKRARARHDAQSVATATLSDDHVELLRALRMLPAEQREAIVLHHLIDLTVDEVALRQGVPVGTVKARLARGRRRMAALLAVDVEEGVSPDVE